MSLACGAPSEAIPSLGNVHVGLRVKGRAEFSRSGRVTISYLQTSTTLTVAGTVTSSSIALATLRTNLLGIYVAAATLDVAAGTLTTYLNKAPGTKGNPAAVDVRWIVVN